MAETVARPEGERVESADAGLVSPERLVFFSDAVIAIAITLLALELPVPPSNEVHGNAQVLEYLGDHLAEYLAFLISFTAIAMHWLAHQRVFRYATGIVLRVIQWDLLWLLMLVVMPFTTKMLTSEVDAFQVQFTIYAADQALAALFLVLAFRSLRRNRLLAAEPPPWLSPPRRTGWSRWSWCSPCRSRWRSGRTGRR